MSKHLLLPVEIYTRSFKSRLRIAHAFASLGGKAIIGPHYTMKKLLKNISAPASYLSKGESTTKPILNLLERYDKKGIRMFLLDEEGGILDHKGLILGFRYNYKTSRYFRRVYLWGKKQQDILRHMIPELETTIVTGNPRFDLLQYTLQNNKVQNNITEFIKSNKKTILINTSFPAGNNIRSDEKLIAFQKHLLGDQFSESEFEMHIAHHRLVYLYFKRLIEKIVEDFGDQVALIIRPHPAENPDGYEQYEKKYANVLIDRARLMNAGVVSKMCVLTIHYDCTTGIEALLSGSRVISYAPFVTEFSQELPLKSTLTLKDYSEVKLLIENVLAEKDDKETYHVDGVKEIEGFIHNFNKEQDTAIIIGKDIYDNSVAGDEDDLKRVLDNYEKEMQKKTLSLQLKQAAKQVLKSIIPKVDDSYKKNKLGSLDMVEIEDYFNSLNKNSDQNIRLKIMSEVFVLEKVD